MKETELERKVGRTSQQKEQQLLAEKDAKNRAQLYGTQIAQNGKKKRNAIQALVAFSTHLKTAPRTAIRVRLAPCKITP